MRLKVFEELRGMTPKRYPAMGCVRVEAGFESSIGLQAHREYAVKALLGSSVIVRENAPGVELEEAIRSVEMLLANDLYGELREILLRALLLVGQHEVEEARLLLNRAIRLTEGEDA